MPRPVGNVLFFQLGCAQLNGSVQSISQCKCRQLEEQRVKCTVAMWHRLMKLGTSSNRDDNGRGKESYSVLAFSTRRSQCGRCSCYIAIVKPGGVMARVEK